MQSEQLNTVILVGSHQRYCESVKLLIDHEQLGEVIAETSSGSGLITLLHKHNPNLVIMDIDMSEMNGIEVAREALKMYPNLKILFLTMYMHFYNKAAILNTGAKGCILKSADITELEKAISMVSSNQFYFSDEVLKN